MTILYTFLSFLTLFDCFQVDQVVSAHNDEPEIQLIELLSFEITDNQLWIGDRAYPINNRAHMDIEHRDELTKSYACSYSFSSCSPLLTAEIQRVTFDGMTPLGSAIDIIRVLDENHYKHFLYSYGHLFKLSACAPEDLCFAPAILPTVVDTVLAGCPLPDQVDSVRITQAELEEVTERVLNKEASTRIEVNASEFEVVTEQRLDAETNVCPEYEAVIDTLSELVLVKEASTSVETIPAIFESVTERVLLSEHHRHIESLELPVDTVFKEFVICPRFITWDKVGFDSLCTSDQVWPCIRGSWDTTSAEIDLYPIHVADSICPDSFNKIENYCIRIKAVPATYGDRKYDKLVYPASTITGEVPAEYTSRTYMVISNKDSIPDSCIVNEYGTYAYEKLVRPASTTTIDIPAEYGERTYLRLATPAAVDVVKTTTSIAEFQKKRVIQEASYATAHQIICDKFLTQDIIMQIATALEAAGYQTGGDTNPRSILFANAIMNFQLDHQLAVGLLTIETLNALNVSL